MNKPNCGNCHLLGKLCPKEVFSMEDERSAVSQDCGLLCHPGAREWLMADVIKELERLGNQDIDPKVFEVYVNACDRGAQEQFFREHDTAIRTEDNLVWMTPEEEEKCIRADERNKILRLVESDEWQKEHDEQNRNAMLDKFKEVIRLHDEDELLYPDLYNEFLSIYKSLKGEQ